jgi:dihydrofolate synthase/folylpolyglutamate synthase
MTYGQATEWLFGLNRFGMKLGLENIRTLLEALGRPQDRFACILVGGTNGKGSTAAMLHSILDAAGVRSGLFTSPHLVRVEERIRIGDRDIDSASLTGIVTELRSLIDALLAAGRLGAHPTFFEVMTSAALLALARAEVEMAVLEVGLGGRLDATNAVDPALSVIATIDLDHTEQLGSTLAAIAREKSGIMRPGVTTAIGDIEGEALEAILEEAAAAGAKLVRAGEGCVVGPLRPGGAHGPPGFSLETPLRNYVHLPCPLPGAHQVRNALLAVRAAELLPRTPRPVGAEAIAAGLARTRWAGRLEWVDGAPPLLLDGAHNPAGARALAAYLDALGRRPVLLFGAMRDKAADRILEILLPRVAAAVFTRPPMDRAAEPGALRDAARRQAMGGARDPAATGAGAAGGAASRTRRSAAAGAGKPPHPPAGLLPGPGPEGYHVEEDAGAGLDRARRLAGPDGIVLVTGSLFLVGAVKARIENRPFQEGERP